MYGAMEFYKKARAKGIKPIIAAKSIYSLKALDCKKEKTILIT